MEILKIKKLHPDAHIPTRAHDTDAGMDLYAMPVEYTDEQKELIQGHLLAIAMRSSSDSFGFLSAAPDTAWEEAFKTGIFIPPHKTVMVPTGIAVSIAPGYMGGIYARSGLASKQYLAPANGVGVLDSSYRGEVKVALHNYSEDLRVIDVGSRIAQLVIQPISLCKVEVVDELDETERGAGSFGSTGTK